MTMRAYPEWVTQFLSVIAVMSHDIVPTFLGKTSLELEPR